LQAVAGVSIAGITDPAKYAWRVPTVAFEHEGITAGEITQYLGDEGIYVWSGNYYVVEIMERLNRGEHGMVRVGPVHYNTPAEIDRLGEVLQRM
jgi:selenocysteine lyase/cysteine desulfurase